MHQISLQEAFPVAQIAARLRRPFDLGADPDEAAQSGRAAPAWRFVGLSILCVLAMAVAGTLSSRGCRVEPVTLGAGIGRDISIAVPADTPCTILVRPGSATLVGFTVDVPPQRGTVTPRGRTGVVYRPNRGYTGDDGFTFSLHGRSSAIVRVRARIH